MWLVLIAGLPPGGVIVLCVFSSLLLFLCFAGFQVGYPGSLVLESISFRSFYWGPRVGVDSGPLPVSSVVSSSLPGWRPICNKLNDFHTTG